MPSRRRPTLIVTTDVSLAHVASVALPESTIRWSQTYATAIASITPEMELLVTDASIDGPMAHLLAALFVEQRPGRSAVVVEAEGSSSPHVPDERVRVLSRPLGALKLAETIRIAERRSKGRSRKTAA